VRKWLLIAAGVACGLLVLAAAVAWFTLSATRYVPPFYQEALQMDRRRQEAACDRMEQKSAALVSDVNTSDRWQATFTQEQINGWLAVDLVKKHAGALPSGFSEPRVAIEPDQLTVACRYRQGAWDTVLSVSLDAYVTEGNQLALRVRGAWAGAVPLPLEDILEQLIGAANEAGLRASRKQIEGDPVILVSVPPPKDSGRKVIEVQSVQLRAGEVFLSGTTRTEPPAPR